MKARDILFVASLVILASIAFSPGTAAACEEYATACAVIEPAAPVDEIVFQDYEVSDPTCVCSADLELVLPPGPDEEACRAG